MFPVYWSVPRNGVPMSSRPAEVGSSDIARETGVGAHIVRPSFPSAVSVDRAGAQYPQGVRRIRKRQSRQRLRCVRPYMRFVEAFRLTGVVAPCGGVIRGAARRGTGRWGHRPLRGRGIVPVGAGRRLVHYCKIFYNKHLLQLRQLRRGAEDRVLGQTAVVGFDLLHVADGEAGGVVPPQAGGDH